MYNLIFSNIMWLSAIIIASFGLVIYLGSNKLSSRTFAFNTILIVSWVVTIGLMQTFVQNPPIVNILTRLCYFWGGTIAASFFYFSKTFPEDQKPRKKLLYAILIIEILLLLPLYTFTDLIIGKSFHVSGLWSWGQTYGPLWFLFDGFFLIFWISGVYILYKKFKQNVDNNLRTNLKYMMAGLIIGFIPPTIVNVLLPRFGYYDLNWLGPLTGCVWVFIIAYSIAKYRQMDVRVAATKIFVIAMVMMAILNIFIDFVFGIYGRIALFLAFAALGYFLYRSLTNEAIQRDQLSSLNSTLSEKVAEQTAEIRKAYELEKHARRELEKLNETKDQFIMLTQHHLRSPVTKIRTGLEAALSSFSGNSGRVSEKLQTSLTETNTSVSRLTKIVDDFLSITTLKAGGQILNIETGNLLGPIEDVLDELKLDIEKMHLEVTYSPHSRDWPNMPIDESKMREALLIIIENAVRYNVPNGKIKITNRIVDDKVLELTIENTGVGITSVDAGKLFNQHYFRSKEALIANPIGMGIGLSVARAVVRAHHGELTIESDGEGKGARVRVRMVR